MSKYIVTELGPIDWHPPGANVTGVYADTTLLRLVEEGYVIDTEAKPATPKRASKQAQTMVPDEPASGGGE